MQIPSSGPHDAGPDATAAGALPAGIASRVAAARVLDSVLHRGRSLKAELATALPILRDSRDRALVEAMVFAALRQRGRYDAALEAWMPKPPGRRDGELRALLYTGFAQLDALALPAHAAVAATVEATRALGRGHQAKLVNALLRRATREGLPAAELAAGWPGWLLQRITRDWPQQRDAIVAASAQQAPLWLRVNMARGSRQDYLRRLQSVGIEAAAPEAARGNFLSQALRIDASMPVSALPGFDAGDVSVQDASAQCVADALSPAVGARVLDACAAPGGKSAQLLERDPSLQLTALDIDPRRARRMGETFARLGVEAQTQAADATDPAAWWDGVPFDAILIDAPCTATGIIRRQPDVLLHRREADLAALTATQARLLDTLWPLLGPGGALLYATCSILREENDAQVAAFLARTADARVDPLDAGFGEPLPDATGGHGHQRFPGEDGMDGFFYARLRKAPSTQ